MRHWYTRYRISNALDEGTLAELRAGGHLSRCAACQAHARDLETLHARLALGAATAPLPAPAPARARGRLLVAAPFALAAAAAIVFAVTSRGTPPPQQPVALPVIDIRGIGDRVTALLASSDKPLDAELENLIHDGRRGLDVVLARSGLVR